MTKLRSKKNPEKFFASEEKIGLEKEKFFIINFRIEV